MKSKLKKITRAGKGKEDPYERILDILLVISITLVGISCVVNIINLIFLKNGL